jgi:hypothetical protein
VLAIVWSAFVLHHPHPIYESFDMLMAQLSHDSFAKSVSGYLHINEPSNVAFQSIGFIV